MKSFEIKSLEELRAYIIKQLEPEYDGTKDDWDMGWDCGLSHILYLIKLEEVSDEN